MRIIFYLLILLSLGCSIVFLLPEGCITVKVVNEDGKPMEGINVGIGFERNTGSGGEGIPVDGITDALGRFTGKHKTINSVAYRAYKDGYYESKGEYRFKNHIGGRWQPWNPEIKIVLRKIENPVPMYARRFGNVLPLRNKDIGCDLIANDWVKPYGNGTHSDIIFHLKKRYVDDNDYSADLEVKFPGRNGFIKYNLNMYNGSEFKLPRYAPIDGYSKQFERHVIRPPGRSLKDDQNDNISYVFRIRSSSPDTVMYGKIQGDIGLSAREKGTASIGFTYYLNPDHTRNLEYDPKRNLFTDLKSFEQVGL